MQHLLINWMLRALFVESPRLPVQRMRSAGVRWKHFQVLNAVSRKALDTMAIYWARVALFLAEVQCAPNPNPTVKNS